MVYDSVCSFDLCGNYGQMGTFRRRKQGDWKNKWNVEIGWKRRKKRGKEASEEAIVYFPNYYYEYENKIYSKQFWGWVIAAN